MSDDSVFKQWAEDFQRSGHEIPRISRSARSSAIRMSLELVGNVVLYPAAVLFMIYSMMVRTDMWFRVYGSITITFCVFASYVYYKSRHGTWKVLEETPRGLLNFLKKQEQARLREIRILNIPLYIVMAAAFVFVTRELLIIWTERPEILVEKLVSFSFSYAVLIAGVFFVRFWVRRKKRNLENVALLEQGFINGVDAG
ncbi:MAG: hypothetical protein GY847_16070 [Proteobacteria bacterium]|nr:hypothetical protein [Pseudomonadota bacterium]